MIDSIPENMLREEEDNSKAIEEFFKNYIEGSTTWREMRIMILGHGRIGKTSLINVIQHLCDNSSPQTNPELLVCLKFLLLL